MRPLQLLWLLLCFMAFPLFLTLLSFSSTRAQSLDDVTDGRASKPGRLSTLFSFRTPVSLFPPSAVISLTDDNSTFFLSRPAAFGPPLPKDSLSSPLWAGSGFFDDENLRRSKSTLGVEGELGCSDVPGWAESEGKPSGSKHAGLKHSKAAVADLGAKDALVAGAHGKETKRAAVKADPDHPIKNSLRTVSPSEYDGTDDYLHHPLPESNPAEHAKPGQPADHESLNDKSKPATHADIQSLQESAEIAGKVVLLSRGGCGFLEKVKWAQRRGGVALIVGDDAPGDPLITMYARGDTSNVTIPALFTSHTTAHLLSSLIPPETQGDHADPAIEAKGRKATQKAETNDDGPIFTAKVGPQPTARPQSPNVKGATNRSGGKETGSPTSLFVKFISIFGLGDGAHYPWRLPEDSRRPPSSGNLDWVLLEDWNESGSPGKSDKLPPQKTSVANEPEQVPADKNKLWPSPESSDGFVIGVQDWRDPDVLEGPEKAVTSTTISSGSNLSRGSSKTTALSRQATGKPEEAKALQGGSITPGSGEYGNFNSAGQRMQKSHPLDEASYGEPPGDSFVSDTDKGWIDSFGWTSSSNYATTEHEKVTAKNGKPSSRNPPNGRRPNEYDSTSEMDTARTGLWVTLTPATMSTSPFFDTLLVLVVSPLVTLTVVYALLVLRSRIRRRRWRAPKSVVDRLPVRIYHTMSSSSSSTSSQTTTHTALSPSSPLLESMSRAVNSRNRPRSQTASGFIPSTEISSDRSSLSSLSTKEKMTPTSAGQKRYTGRQIECCVCLEEYIDGQSRVMGLPCGHEFHADCITPWLVRRRRTCPICKGDVVKSMAHGSSDDRRHDGEYRSDDVQSRVAETVNDTRSAAIPIPPHLSIEDDQDLEQGSDASTPLVGSSTAPRSGWRNLTSLNMLALSGDTAVWRSSPSDRNR